MALQPGYFNAQHVDNINESKFHINISNELGLKYKKQRAALLGVALAKPGNYYKLRADIVEQLTQQQVEQFYNMYWQFFKNGVINGAVVTYQDERDRQAFLKPDLPEHIINKFSSRVSATIEEIAEEAVSMVLPDDFLKMAQEKQKDLLGARGQI